MSTNVTFDEEIGELFLRYAKMVVGRGYIYNSLGNMVIRVPHPDYQHGVAYTKHAGVSLEEMAMEHIVITDIPTSALLYGTEVTSVGHNLNREILRLRPDIGAVIHVHHNETIAYFASGGFKELKMLALDTPYVLAKPPYYVGSHLDVEADVAPIKAFIAETNTLVMLSHGVTTLGRHISEAYHRLTTLAAEVQRVVLAEQLATSRGTKVEYLDPQDVKHMYRFAENVIYPDRAEGVMAEDAETAEAPAARKASTA